jgi:hypothetical protein
VNISIHLFFNRRSDVTFYAHNIINLMKQIYKIIINKKKDFK